jgi:hypothetical protein
MLFHVLTQATAAICLLTGFVAIGLLSTLTANGVKGPTPVGVLLRKYASLLLGVI